MIRCKIVHSDFHQMLEGGRWEGRGDNTVRKDTWAMLDDDGAPEGETEEPAPDRRPTPPAKPPTAKQARAAKAFAAASEKQRKHRVKMAPKVSRRRDCHSAAPPLFL